MLGPLAIATATALFLAGYQTYLNKNYSISRGAFFWWAWSALVLFTCGLAAAFTHRWISLAFITPCFLVELGWISWRLEDTSEFDDRS